MSTRIIKILVGPEETPFYIHEGILTARSEFFEDAIRQGSWKESNTRTVKFPEDNLKMFALYMQLAYTGVISPVYYGDNSRGRTHMICSCDHPEYFAEEYESLCRLYVFSEKVRDVNAKKATLSALISKINQELLDRCDLRDPKDTKYLPGAKAINIMYGGTMEHDVGRMVLVDCYVKVGSGMPWGKPDIEMVDVEFLKDLVKNFLAMPSKSLRLSAADYMKEC